MNIGTVVEGPTDRLILKTMVTAIIPGRHRFFPLQPMETFGKTGTGWKGVRRWCQDLRRRGGAGIESILSDKTGPPLDLLVIQVDADVADEPDLVQDSPTSAEISKPCPPVADTVEGLRAVIQQWINRRCLPTGVILAIPAQDIEHWIFAALFPEDPCCQREDYECPKPIRQSPAYLLSLESYGKLTRRKGNTIKKPQRRYHSCIDTITRNINMIEQICTQGHRFRQDLRDHLGQHTAPEGTK